VTEAVAELDHRNSRRTADSVRALPLASVTFAVTFDPATPIVTGFFAAVVASVVVPSVTLNPPVVIESLVVVRESDGGPRTCTLIVRALLVAVSTLAPA